MLLRAEHNYMKKQDFVSNHHINANSVNKHIGVCITSIMGTFVKDKKGKGSFDILRNYNEISTNTFLQVKTMKQEEHPIRTLFFLYFLSVFRRHIYKYK